MQYSKRISTALTTVAAAALLTACSGDNSSIANTPPPAATTAEFEVTLVNLTAGQPLSPMVAVAHNAGFSMFNVGEPTSVALEHLAEAGESAQMAALASASKSVHAAAVAGGGPLMGAADKRATVTLTVPLAALPDLRLSMASMLGNTNDGFAGLNARRWQRWRWARASTLFAWLRRRHRAQHGKRRYRAGTGDRRQRPQARRIQPARDDIVNAVHLHPGEVSKDDGLPTSALSQAQRWVNPVALVSIKRVR